MTAALAIAATSEVLRYIVNDALTRAANDLQFTAPAVSTGAPPRPSQTTQLDVPAVNLFLHFTAPNPAWRNLMAPARDGEGRRLNNNPLILDLHYLLSAHGPEVLREIGLGTALHALHQAGIVPRELIRRALAPLASSADENKKAVARSRLADQLESLTITPQALDIDAVTKIWTATQSPYRPSVGFLVTTVFLEDVKPSRAPLPVASPALASVPVSELAMQSVEGSRADKRWPITTDAALIVTGSGFANGTLTAALGEVPLLVAVADSGPAKLKLTFDAGSIANLRSGPQLLRLSVSTDLDGRAMKVQSAGVAVVLRPAITIPANPNVPPTPSDPNSVTGPIDVDVAPPVARTQRATLMLTPLAGGSDQSIAWSPPAPANPPVDSFTTLTFKLSKVPKGQYLARIAIDGTSSQPMLDNAGQFQPQVKL